MAHPTTPAPGPVRAAEALAVLRDALAGPVRRHIVARLTEGSIEGQADAATALAGLRRCMRTHRWPVPSGTLDLRRVVDSLDGRTRREGLHVLYGWDFQAQRRPADIVPVLLTDYCERLGVAPGAARRTVAILVDQYFLSLLMLPTVRAWDDGAPEAVLDDVTALLALLNGPDGAGVPIVDDAESLLMLAVAYYHPEEAAYDAQLGRVRMVDAPHALRFAFPCAAIMASHLRWGLRFMYRSDIGTMRADNLVDYPWSLFALATLMREYERLATAAAPDGERLRVAAAVLDGLSPDPWAFDGKLPAFLAPCAAEHAGLREALHRHRDGLLRDFDACRPVGAAYSPLGFSCNFLSNAVVAGVVTAAGGGEATPSLNTLFAPGVEAAAFAERLMAFAGGSPERLGAGGAPLIVYDRRDAAHYHNVVMRALREGAGRE
jgi:hypothetical protein